MSRPYYSAEEIARRGRELYERFIRDSVEADNKGKFLVLDIETGEYEIDSDDRTALSRADARHPEGLFYLLRIGYPAAHRLGGRFPAGRP